MFFSSGIVGDLDMLFETSRGEEEKDPGCLLQLKAYECGMTFPYMTLI